jgi:hypothetical protein
MALHHDTFASAQTVRTERRRQASEQEAHLMHEISTDPSAATDWERLRPVLYDTMDELDDGDREAVLLRFFEGRSFADVGAKQRLTENAARMRVERALDKMHGLLARRGVTSTTAALAFALASQASVAAPAGLGATVTGAALMGAAAGAGAAGWGLYAFMSTTKTGIGLVSAASVIGLTVALVGASKVHDAGAALAVALGQEKALQAKMGELKNRVEAETRRLRVADNENEKLLAAAKKFQITSATEAAAEAEPITSDAVSRRFKRAQELVRSGDPAEALRELLWCYDVGMPRISGMSAVRTTSLNLFGELGNRYPPALAVLRERREKAREVMMTSEQEFAATQEFAAINRALKDEAANVALLDQLPAGDQRRMTLAGTSYETLVENRRYREALEGRPYGSLSSSFERSINMEVPANLPNGDEARRSGHEYLIATTVKNIEALAGAGDLEHARNLAERLLAYDPSESTRALIQKHAERAGQPALLSKPANQ